jgi:ADP-ribosylglycohydrolase
MQKASGCMFGLALGDAFGARVEFMSVERILEIFPPSGPQELEGNPALVTDDTQMALAVGEALIEAGYPLCQATVEAPLRHSFIRWAYGPDNNRAPGITCMRACKNLKQGLPWQEATVVGSKGCGANMRVAPVGLVSRLEPEVRAGLAQFQAALTHGHPTGLAAADLTAWVVADLKQNGDLASLPRRIRNYAQSQLAVYHADWLGNLWKQPMIDSPQDFIKRGWDECLAIINRLETGLKYKDSITDPCLVTGDGWVAEEAFGTALLCFLMYPDRPVAVIQRAAVTRGDSDSIACIAGAFAGAYMGLDAWPQDWIDRIEYYDRLALLGKLWDRQ